MKISGKQGTVTPSAIALLQRPDARGRRAARISMSRISAKASRRAPRFAATTLLLTLIAAPPAAASFPDNSAVVFSSPGDWVGKGTPHVYTDENASFTVTGAAAEPTVDVVGTDGSWFDMTFAARRGDNLAPGVYKNAERAPFRSANRPGMDISGNGAGCNTISGNFTVKDIAADATGAIERLQVLYEQHCEGAQPALFGEIRIGEPATGAAAATPSELNWPDSQFGAPTAIAAVALLVARPMSIVGMSISGRDAADFQLTTVSCAGGAPCPDPSGPFDSGSVAGSGVVFAPRQSGNRAAVLRIADSVGDTYTVPLHGSTSR